VSQELLGEVQRNLVKKIKLPESVAADFCRLLRNNASLAAPTVVASDACRDPKDLDLLGLAECAQAEFLVTGDKDLLEAGWPGLTKIVTPRQFWEKCREK
jgi:putative PIN family toxin of toxin-antitoxin system